jgi:hypothetical protein
MPIVTGEFEQKRRLRLQALADMLETPVVLEAYGGNGLVYSACYRHIEKGVVFEKNRRKAEVLARQRDTWAVYCGDTVHLLAAGLGSHLALNFVDIDARADPWPAIEAFLTSERPKPELVQLVVTDGLWQALRQGGAWKIPALMVAVQHHENYLDAHYLDICQETMEALARSAGYRLERWAGFYGGRTHGWTHYRAVIRRQAAAS